MTDADIYLQWGIALVVAIFMFARGQFSLFHPSVVYLGFHVIVFCIRPTLVHFFEFGGMFEYMGIRPNPDEMRLALFVSSAGLIALVAGFTIAIRNAPPLKLKGHIKLTPENRRAFYIMAAIFVPLGIYSIIAGGTSERAWVLNNSTGYINDLHQVFIPITVLLILVARWKWWSYLPFLVYVFYRSSQGQTRWTIVMSLFLITLVWLWNRRRRIPPVWLLVALPLVFVLWVNISHDRGLILRYFDGSSDRTREIASDNSPTFQEKWDTADFASFDSLTFIVGVVPDHTDTYTFGTQYLQLFTEPIPRALWTNKPAGPPIEFFDLNDYGNFRGLTPSLVGDGWMSFGWLGVGITLGTAGVILGIAYSAFARNQDIAHRAFAFLICNAVIVQLFRDGGITVFKFLLFTLAPVLLWSRLSRHFALQSAIADGFEEDDFEEVDIEDDEDGEDEDFDDLPEGDEFDDEEQDLDEEPEDDGDDGDDRPFPR
jgi:hypothetical protein